MGGNGIKCMSEFIFGITSSPERRDSEKAKDG